MFLRLLVLLALSIVCDAAALAFRDVTVIDVASATAVEHQNVIVFGRRISAAGPARSTPVPAQARVIDGRGKFLIPGLWDMHVHLWYKENQLPAYVLNGVTGVRDMGSNLESVSAWRRDVLAGRAIGPHIVTPGPPVTGKPSGDAKLPALVAPTPAEARQAVDRLEQMGADFVKVLSDLPHDSYIALAERARHERIDFAGHVPSGVSAWEALDARQASIEHLFGLFAALAANPKKPIDTFSEARAKDFFTECATFGIRHVPTLTMWQRMTYVDAARRMSDPRLELVPASIRNTWPKPEEEQKDAAAVTPDALRQLALASRMVKLMEECGVDILAGTDTGDPYTIPGVTLHEELALLVSAGLTPAEALRTATILPAKFLHWDNELGLIKRGYIADLVLLDANPLTSIANISKIDSVVSKGRYLDRSERLRLLGIR